jgi:hypothetical protein
MVLLVNLFGKPAVAKSKKARAKYLCKRMQISSIGDIKPVIFDAAEKVPILSGRF